MPENAEKHPPFVEKINEIPKKLKIHKEAFKMLAGKDCPRNTIWRHNLIKKDSEMKEYKEMLL